MASEVTEAEVVSEPVWPDLWLSISPFSKNKGWSNTGFAYSTKQEALEDLGDADRLIRIPGTGTAQPKKPEVDLKRIAKEARDWFHLHPTVCLEQAIEHAITLYRQATGAK